MTPRRSPPPTRCGRPTWASADAGSRSPSRSGARLIAPRMCPACRLVQEPVRCRRCAADTLSARDAVDRMGHRGGGFELVRSLERLGRTPRSLLQGALLLGIFLASAAPVAWTVAPLMIAGGLALLLVTATGER